MVDTVTRPRAGRPAPEAGPHRADRRERPGRRPRRRPVEVASTILLSVVGLVGAVCLLWLAVSTVLGLSLVVVLTGSMSPTVPAGGAVVTRAIAAADVRPGDVVTVPRPGFEVPVTHRVVSTTAVPGDAAARSLVLRGDANDTDDRDPYVVRDARIVVASAPGLGFVLTTMSTPPARGLAVAVVGAAVVLAFWPTRRGAARRG
ncbi:signal peptidase I [Frigoribacterium sp. R86507]|uniref:signal peptidase I n=1 Tax=Frigoribacterium sp. R86507 TaxID=3093850 RepID=UPI0037C99CBB